MRCKKWFTNQDVVMGLMISKTIETIFNKNIIELQNDLV